MMKVLLTDLRHAEPLSRYYLRNAERLRPWEPAWPLGHHTVSAWRVVGQFESSPTSSSIFMG